MSSKVEKNMSKNNENKIKLSGSVIQTILLSLVFLGTAVSAYYSYQASSTLDNIVKGIAPSAKTAKTNTVSISKKYAKDYTLEKAKESGKPVVAVFYADWCGYCKKFAPTFAKIIKKKQFKNNLSAAFVNCEAPENAKYVQEYNITGFPSVYMINFKTGEKVRVPNNTLFTQNAEKDLLKTFVEFSKK